MMQFKGIENMVHDIITFKDSACAFLADLLYLISEQIISVRFFLLNKKERN